MIGTDRTNGSVTPKVETEVSAKPRRPRYTAEYKRKIVDEIARAPHGGKAAILRREGLYAATVDSWRRDLESALEPRARGRKPSPDTPLKKENEKLRKQIARLERKLEHAALIIDVQKKVARMLDATQDQSSDES
jgi:transposase-like protein